MVCSCSFFVGWFVRRWLHRLVWFDLIWLACCNGWLIFPLVHLFGWFHWLIWLDSIGWFHIWLEPVPLFRWVGLLPGRIVVVSCYDWFSFSLFRMPGWFHPRIVRLISLYLIRWLQVVEFFSNRSVWLISLVDSLLVQLGWLHCSASPFGVCDRLIWLVDWLDSMWLVDCSDWFACSLVLLVVWSPHMTDSLTWFILISWLQRLVGVLAGSVGYVVAWYE